MWAKPLKRNQGAYLIFEMPILVPPSRQRLTALAFPLSRVLDGGEDLTLLRCSVSPPTDFGVTLIEACFLEQTD